MRSVNAFLEAEDAEPWRRYIIRTSDGEETAVERPGVVTWGGTDPEFVRIGLGADGFLLIALDAVVVLEFPSPR
jgi:hypothetical protein